MSETKNKVKFGLCNIHIAKIIEENGEITYGTPFKVPGARNLTTDPEGESTPFYADNIKYYTAVSNQGYTGELEVAMTPEEFLTEILGQLKDSNGALIESADDVQARFALMGEIDGDVKKRRFVYYDCTATRPSNEASTIEESKDPKTDTIALTMSPRSTDKLIKAVIEPSETNKNIYDTFFKKVYEKNATVTQEGV